MRHLRNGMIEIDPATVQNSTSMIEDMREDDDDYKIL